MVVVLERMVGSLEVLSLGSQRKFPVVILRSAKGVLF